MSCSKSINGIGIENKLVLITENVSSFPRKRTRTFALTSPGAYVKTRQTGEYKPHSILIFKGAASGIGATCAELCVNEGATIVAVDKNEITLQFASSDDNHHHMRVVCDVTSSGAVDQLAIDIYKRYNRHPDCVIHCAGIVGAVGGLEGTTEEIYDKVMDTNMKGTFLINRKFVLLMRDHKIKGSIVNVSSLSVQGARRVPACAASKGAQQSWTMSIAKEFASAGIRCNTVHPTITATQMLTNNNIVDEQTLTKVAQLATQLPMGRPAEPMEVAQMCAFLISDRASYISGSCHYVTGAHVHG